MFKQKAVRKKDIITLSIFGLLFIIIFCIAQYFDYSYITPVNITDVNDGTDVKWNIDEINFSTENISISGWAIVINEAPTNFDLNIVLENTETKESIAIPTILVGRDDLNLVFNDGTDYSQNGFFSKLDIRKIDLLNHAYHIYIGYFSNGHRFFINTDLIIPSTLEK